MGKDRGGEDWGVTADKGALKKQITPIVVKRLSWTWRWGTSGQGGGEGSNKTEEKAAEKVRFKAAAQLLVHQLLSGSGDCRALSQENASDLASGDVHKRGPVVGLIQVRASDCVSACEPVCASPICICPGSWLSLWCRCCGCVHMQAHVEEYIKAQSACRASSCP